MCTASFVHMCLQHVFGANAWQETGVVKLLFNPKVGVEIRGQRKMERLAKQSFDKPSKIALLVTLDARACSVSFGCGLQRFIKCIQPDDASAGMPAIAGLNFIEALGNYSSDDEETPVDVLELDPGEH